MVNNNKRFIEESFPVKEVSIESAREKNIRHGHISTLHIWWARKPLASSRATNYAALIPAPNNTEEWNKQRNFIAEFSKWENSLNQNMIKKAREDILKANGGKPPKVLDPFAGGGAIPLEALRLGCEVYSNDYNPVAVLIQKCVLEYPQKYGKTVMRKKRKDNSFLEEEIEVNPLLEDVKKWGNWILKETKQEIGKFYPEDKDGFTPVGYYWMNTIPCQNPSCGIEIPLTPKWWLVEKSNKKVALYPYVDGKDLKFKIVGTGYENIPKNFNPDEGTVSRAITICPVCGSSTEAKTTRTLFQQNKSGQRMIAVVLHKPGEIGKKYRLVSEKDILIFGEAEAYLSKKREDLMRVSGIDPIPDEPLARVPVSFGVINLWIYGMNNWGDIFNSRQKLSLITFTEKTRAAYKEMIEQGYSEDYAKAILSYMGFALDRQVDYNSVLCVWATSGEFIAHTFGRQALGMIWNYFELYPWSQATGDWNSAINWILKFLDNCSRTSRNSATITQNSANSMPYNDNYFDAVFTDPPYYDNVPYSYLSDFFYVWLKRTLGDIYPELFSTPLTPKKQEIVAYSNGPGGWGNGKDFFEKMLNQSFREIYRVLKPDGIAVIVYAHKSTEGWETLINSLLDSGLIMVGAWPVDTEKKGRMRANKSAALASSIYIVARKMKRKSTGFYNDVKKELKEYLDKKLERLWNEGVGGADFFISAIGSAIVVFGKYEKVMDYEGNIVRADRLLLDVRKIATDYAVSQILHNGFSGEITDLARFYVLYRWNYGSVKIPFDEARKLAQSCGVDLSREWAGRGYIKKQSEFIKVLGPQERKIDDIDSAEMIDVLHKTLLYWEKGERVEMINLLKSTGYGNSEAFYRVAQAVSETLTKDDKEKKLLEGFLSGKERIKNEVKEGPDQRRLFK
jgi:putative DNA methylase